MNSVVSLFHFTAYWAANPIADLRMPYVNTICQNSGLLGCKYHGFDILVPIYFWKLGWLTRLGS